jgi:signal transduction histidine kinase/CheY-like chemotaxis protein
MTANPKGLVLVVDDEELVREFCVEALTAAGFDAIAVEDAPRALDRLRHGGVDVVLMDIILPGLSGLEALRLIQEAAPDFLVIMITAAPTTASAIEALKCGAYDFLAKPLEPADLARAVERAVERRRLLLDRRRLLEDLERRNAELRFLLDASLQLFTTLDVKAIMSEVLRQLAQVLPASRTSIITLEPDHKTGIFIAGFKDARYGPNAAPGLRLDLARSPEILAAVRRRAPVLVADVAADPLVAPVAETLLAHGIRSILVVPLCLHEQVSGVITVAQYGEGPTLTPDQVELCAGLARQAGAALETARLYEELKQKTLALEVASRHKSDFLSNMSHELRTPLNCIIGFSDLLLEKVFGGLSPRQERYVGNIKNSGKLLLQLINEILDLAKIEAGRMELHREDVAVDTLVEGALTLIKPLAAQKRLRLHTEGQAPGLRVHADPQRLKQILLNLLSNAVKFTPEGGAVTVCIAQEAAPAGDGAGRPSVEISVADTGPGIAPEDQAPIFEPFRQGDTSLARKHQGTGLGLALTKSFVEMHGGRIWVESAPGQGAAFRLTIPMAQPAPPAPPRPAAAPAQPTLRGEPPLVLVVDDSPRTVELQQAWLAQAGYRVATAFTGPEAVEKARTLRPFAITLDVMLPGRDGWEVLNELKRDAATREIPVVVVSVLEEEAFGLALGAMDYLTKPIDRATLLGTLNRLGIAPPGASRSGPATVLLVDDDRFVLEMLAFALEQEGLKVLQAADGVEGLRAALESAPDLIITDLVMPKMNGLQLIDVLRRNPQSREIPIVVLSGRDLGGEERLALRSAVQAFATKDGFSLDGFIRELQRLERLARRSPASL